ncbi:histidine-type phosphatase [Pedobacter nototheniae]|uniref:histidine-type phosphatase n=1 Tax=Pedobacter nototheniae TaxID=2488994 RepID=UPI00292E8A93|nr:histidine-type phosphatase [Pedobacter nototheniae]
MKNIFTTLLLSFGFLCAFAQKNSLALGTKTLYTPLQQKYAPVPKGYEVAYINYVGRHGARHLTKDVAKSYAWKILFKADSLNELSSLGKQLKNAVVNLQKVEIKHLESISVVGAEELELIAKRLYLNQKTLFKSDVKLLVATTKKGRTKESAEAFLEGLKKEDVNAVKDVKFNYADDDNLRFHDFSKTYDEFKENGSWLKTYNQLTKALGIEVLTANFTSKFFTADFCKTLNKLDRANFTDDIYGFYGILSAIPAEIKANGLTAKDINLKSFFTQSDLTKLGKINDAEDYLKKAPGTNNDGIQVKIAAPLLADFIKSTDAFIQSKPYTADLRFAHAETIAPFAAILNLNGASTATHNILAFDKVWKAEEVVPFSSNIQWIFYKRADKSIYLVKFMLNEREVAINGLSTKTFPYYNWNAVRKFYMQKLNKFGYKLEGNAHEYLLHVK